jgi:radical SAM superfamily enzyme YgiQ (UPF0313 family)
MFNKLFARNIINKNKKLLLIKAPLDNQADHFDQWNMPLDLMAVADASQKAGFLVKILDGTLVSLNEILNHVSEYYDIVGLSYNVFSTRSAKSILLKAKESGCFVIVGGQAATGNAELLVKQDFIDAVVTGDGEPMVKALANISEYSPKYLQNVPNLLFRNKDEVIKTYLLNSDIYNLNYVDRHIGGLNPSDYFANYPGHCTMQNIKCRQKCSFCARIDRKSPRVRDVKLVGEEIKYLIDVLGADYIVDHSETWFEKNWIHNYKNYHDSYLKDYDFHMFAFSDVRYISPDTASLMHAVNINQTLIGIESGSPRILKRNGKYYSRDSIIRAADLLTGNNIGIYASFVVGLLDEDEESLEETRSVIQQLSANENITCNCNIIVPLPHSKLWQPLLASLDKIPASINDPFNYDIQEITSLFLKTQTKVSLPLLESFSQAMNSLK